MSSDTVTDDDAIDLESWIFLPEMCLLLKTGDDAIRARLKDGTFPIPPSKNIDHRLRWWGPAVKRWLDEQGAAPPPKENK